jgi:DNA-binding CsgD family transcriptional regulator
LESTRRSSGVPSGEPPEGEIRGSDDLLSLLGSAEGVVNIGSWEWLPRSNTRLWSDNLYRLFGLEPGEIVPDRRFFLKQTHADDKQRVTRFLRSARWMSDPPPIEIRMHHRTLGVRYMRATIATLESDARGATRIVGCVQDVTEERQTRQEIAAFLGVSETLAVWDTLEAAPRGLLRELGTALGFAFGVLWVPGEQSLVPVASWSEPTLDAAEIERASLELRCAPGIGLPGRAWASKQPQRLYDVGEDGSLSRRLAAGAVGLSGAVAFPALHSSEVVAVLEFYYGPDRTPPEQFTRTMVAIGYELGEFLSHRRGQMLAQHLTERQLEVLALAAAGNTAPRIAIELGLSPATVRTHFEHVYAKLGVTDRAAAVAQAVRLGLIA